MKKLRLMEYRQYLKLLPIILDLPSLFYFDRHTFKNLLLSKQQIANSKQQKMSNFSAVNDWLFLVK